MWQVGRDKQQMSAVLIVPGPFPAISSVSLQQVLLGADPLDLMVHTSHSLPGVHHNNSSTQQQQGCIMQQDTASTTAISKSRAIQAQAASQ
jgi:hypothetical protein